MPKAGIFLAALVLSAIAAVSAAGAEQRAAGEAAVVASVYDGDTLTLTGGRRVRLLQIDTPELGSAECYSRAARTALVNLAPLGSRIVLESDPALDKVDRYGRLLRYVFKGGTNVNLKLVREGAATAWYYQGERGRYAAALLRGVQQARAGRRGLWKACPSTVLDPEHAVTTGRSGPPPPIPPRTGTCDPNYTGGCVPPAPPDLDCKDIHALGIKSVRVVGLLRPAPARRRRWARPE